MKGRKISLLPVCLFLGFLVLSVALPPELLSCIYFPSASCSLDSLRQSTHWPAVQREINSVHKAHCSSKEQRAEIKTLASQTDSVLDGVEKRCSLEFCRAVCSGGMSWSGLLFYSLPHTKVFFFFLIIYLFIYLFICGCVRSSFLCEGFLQLWQAGATLHRGARASHYRGLSCCGGQAPDAQAQ